MECKKLTTETAEILETEQTRLVLGIFWQTRLSLGPVSVLLFDSFGSLSV